MSERTDLGLWIWVSRPDGGGHSTDIVLRPWWVLGQFKEKETAPWSILRCLGTKQRQLQKKRLSMI
jgi:hypothetical protein